MRKHCELSDSPEVISEQITPRRYVGGRLRVFGPFNEIMKTVTLNYARDFNLITHVTRIRARTIYLYGKQSTP